MIWDRSETIALAKLQCGACGGLGLCSNAQGEEIPCDCVLRAIFKICHRRFKSAAHTQHKVSIVKLEHSGGGQSSHMYFSRKTEEYLADFTAISRRNLTPEDYTMFKFHYLLGADVSLVARQLKMSHTNLLYHYARMEAKLGRAFRETEPFSLYPLDQYFSDTARGEKVFASRPGGRAA